MRWLSLALLFSPGIYAQQDSTAELARHAVEAHKRGDLPSAVNDYRKLVDEKLRTAGDLYEFMVDEFHQARTFLLELMVVAILIIELARVFWRP